MNSDPCAIDRQIIDDPTSTVSRRAALIGLGSAIALPVLLRSGRAGAATQTTTKAVPTTRPASSRSTTTKPVAAKPGTTKPSTTKSATTVAAATGKASITDSSYSSSTTKLAIQQIVTGSGDDTLVLFVADVMVADPRVLRGGFAQNKFGTNIIANTSTIAAENKAVFAINGDYYGFRNSGILVRNGVAYREQGPRSGLAQYKDGTLRVYDETTTSASELVKAGVWNTVSFGPALVVDGNIPAGIDTVEVDTNVGNHSVQGLQPRTGVGMISPNHYLFIVADGRSRGYSRGVTMSEFAGIFAGLGATVAYNLDGGGSSTMWFNGKVVNNPLGKGRERGTSDILYIAG